MHDIHPRTHTREHRAIYLRERKTKDIEVIRLFMWLPYTGLFSILFTTYERKAASGRPS
jgi:hypothetical protein